MKGFEELGFSMKQPNISTQTYLRVPICSNHEISVSELMTKIKNNDDETKLSIGIDTPLSEDQDLSQHSRKKHYHAIPNIQPKGWKDFLKSGLI